MSEDTPGRGPDTDPFPAQRIALGMPQLAPLLEDGTPVHRGGPEDWARLLRPALDAGFDAVEVPTTWISLPEMGAAARAGFFALLADLGLAVPGISVARRSILERGREAENLAYHHAAIDAAAEAGVPIVCMGLHEPLTEAQRAALWFWERPGRPRPSDAESYARAVSGFRELGAHAASVGVAVSLEIYEDTYLGEMGEAVRLVTDIGLDAVGLNPDIGNLLRLSRPVARWEEMIEAAAPLTNYWHVKNYTRAEFDGTGRFVTAPAPMELGIINYRAALPYMRAHGFRGTLVVEHYGGDGIGVSAINRDYLRRLLG